MNFIEKLQSKPRYIRVQVLWISVILVMFVVFSFWLIYLKSSLGPSQETQKKESIPSLFGTIKEDLSFLKENLQAQVKGVIGEREEQSKFEVEIIK